MSQETSKINSRIRWMIRRDMLEVLKIENASFENPWLEEDFMRCLRRRKCLGMVVEQTAEQNDKRHDYITGFMIYELNERSIDIFNFAVHPDYRRQRVGTCMIDKLKSKLSLQKRKK